MSPRDIESLCRNIVPGCGSVAVEPLSAGLLSATYRVTRDGVPYTLKVAAAHRPDLRVDFAWEAQVLEAAATAGLAPRQVYSDAAGAVMLATWVAGRTWVTLEPHAAANLSRIAELLRRVHALEVPQPPRAISPLQWIDIYATALSRRTLPDTDPALRTAARTRAQQLALLPRAQVVCHSDLHAQNLIEQKGALILLDWEYAHATDPLWDLAGWSANNDLDAESQQRLLTDYLGRAPASSHWQRLRLLLWLYDYVCLLWSQLYLSVRPEGASGVAERARLLDARLHLPAHYAA